jgi:hypothetical protein
MLSIGFTRISPTQHRFDYTRPDGSGESRIFETRSTLRHDLVHFAYETEAGLTDSFYGLLAKGATFDDLAGKGADAFEPGVEIGLTERIVGPLSGVAYGDTEPQAFLVGFARYLSSQGEAMPAGLTLDLVRRVTERYRRLHGQWKSTPFGETMTLNFAPRLPS